jgi:CPA2 family monovalent cation:H+ antiporter-2
MAAETAQNLYPLISDLGLILMTAGVALLLFKKIKQPVVLGYLIAGFIAGNHFDFFPTVQDMHSVEVWAQIGVIFLLFSLGLEFSFKKLVKVGGTASVTALTQIAAMLVLGYAMGRLLGWQPMDCLFLAVMLSVSSTTIIVKTFGELGVKAQRFAGNVIGALVVQDLLAILMMVVLSTMAMTRAFSGSALLFSCLKLVFFLILWFVGGIFFIPTLLKRARHLLTDEMALIISLALCLMMVMLATKAGFSPALGAFIMGSVIAETTQAEHIEHLVRPVRDLFGAVFFVSVGMLINPHALAEHWPPVLLLTVVTIVGQSVSAMGGALISGQPFKESVRTGMSLSQIGEFSFIIATMGMSIGATSEFLYPVIVAVSAVTTFTTPFMIRFSQPLAEFLSHRLPRKWLKEIERYSANAQSIRSAGNWQIVLRAYLTQILVHSVIIVAIVLLASRIILPMTENSRFGHLLTALGTIIAVSPFLWALSLRRVAAAQVQELLSKRKYRGPIIMMVLARFGLALFFIGFLIDNFFSRRTALIAFFICVVLYVLFPKKLNKRYQYIESHFIRNFNAREIVKARRQRSDLTPWDGHMAYFDIARESNLVGKELSELRLRELLGVNVVFIRRGEITIKMPGRGERLFPGDEVCVLGDDNQIRDFQEFLTANEIAPPDTVAEDEIVLRQIELDDQTFIGQNIRKSGLREMTNGLVVGLERRGKRILNPDSLEILEKGDILWIVGDRKLLRKMREISKAQRE